MSDLQPVVLVTGASKGIGLAATKALLEELNASVATISRTISPELLELREKHPDQLRTYQVDLTDEDKVRETIRSIAHLFGRLNGLVLNAAVVEPIGRVDDENTVTESWRNHFDLNFFSLLYCVQESLPILKTSGSSSRIIFISSGSAEGGIGGMGAYNASKAAMNSFCRTLASEEPNIFSIALRPGMVDTPMQTLLRETGASKGIRGEDMVKFESAHRKGKLVKPEDSGYCIASLVLNATKDLSGKFVSWDSEECKPYRRT